MDFLGDPRNVPYATLLGSTVDTCLASVYEAFWKIFTFMDPRISAKCLVRQRIHAHASDYGGSGVESTWAVACARLVCFVRRHLCRGAEADSHGPVQDTIEILQLQYTEKVIDVFCAGPALECRRGGDSRAPTVAARGGPGVVFVWAGRPCALAQGQG